MLLIYTYIELSHEPRTNVLVFEIFTQQLSGNDPTETLLQTKIIL